MLKHFLSLDKFFWPILFDGFTVRNGNISFRSLVKQYPMRKSIGPCRDCWSTFLRGVKVFGQHFSLDAHVTNRKLKLHSSVKQTILKWIGPQQECWTISLNGIKICRRNEKVFSSSVLLKTKFSFTCISLNVKRKPIGSHLKYFLTSCRVIKVFENSKKADDRTCYWNSNFGLQMIYRT